MVELNFNLMLKYVGDIEYNIFYNGKNNILLNVNMVGYLYYVDNFFYVYKLIEDIFMCICFIIVLFGFVGNFVIIVKIVYDLNLYILIFIVIGCLVMVDVLLIVNFNFIIVINNEKFVEIWIILMRLFFYYMFYWSFFGYVLLLFIVRYLFIVYLL